MNRYFIARDADTIAKFCSKIAAWNYKYELYKINPETNPLPKATRKNDKWPAYEAASRIERTLELPIHASSVPELAATLAAAIEWLNKN